MIAHDDTVYILAAVAAEPDRRKKITGLRLLALLRRDEAAEPPADRMVGCIASELGGPAAEHAMSLLRTTGLA